MTSVEGYNGYAHAINSGSLAHEPSITSSVPSSQGSIFSDDTTLSSQSSAASSIPGDFRHSQEEARDRACAQAQLQAQQWKTAAAQGQAPPLNFGCPAALPYNAAKGVQSRSYADVTSVPFEQGQNLRRNSIPRKQNPPPLVRQSDRKVNFVDNLVDSATQMVEVIWPLSVPCGANGGTGRGVLPLRTYIEETLRRSRTSYSTLQVALYYLVLIKPFVPRCDFTQEQKVDCPGTRSLMCGRRMFLTALILASKYLQDRNYSAKAWSKMSSLKVSEINTNERTFLAKIGWKLHLPELIFKRWTEIVLRYTPSMQPPGAPGQAFAVSGQPSWRSIVPLLTPELDRVPLPGDSGFPTRQSPANYGFASPLANTTPNKSPLDAMQVDSTSQESTPTPTALPRMEPGANMAPPTPALARMGPLPTPQLTPTSVATFTPAASACSSRRPSMCSAMSTAQRQAISRCAIDTFPNTTMDVEKYRTDSRRPSVVSSTSQGSSPESMMSDNSRSSRASSISSVSTVSTASSIAPNRACLARQATCRSGRLVQQPQLAQAQPAAHKQTTQEPITIMDDVEMTSSPPDFSVGEKALHAPHKHSKHAPQLSTTSSTPKHLNNSSNSSARKRCRTSANKRSELQEEIRIALEEEDYDEDDDDVSLSSNSSDESAGGNVGPSPAAVSAQRMLWQSNTAIRTKEAQAGRLPVSKMGGKKRTCCSSASYAGSGAGGLYGEVDM